MEKFLNLLDSTLGEVYDLVLLTYDVVSGLFLLDSHDGIHLGILRKILASFHLANEYIAHLIKLG